MKYYHYHGNTAYCGTDIDEYLALPDDEEIDVEDYEEAMLQQLYDDYSHFENGWDGDEPDEDNFKADCNVYIVEISEEEYKEAEGE